MLHCTFYSAFGNEDKTSVYIDEGVISKKISDLRSKLQTEALNAPLVFYFTPEFAPKWDAYFKKYKKNHYQLRMKYLRKRGARK